MNSVKKLRLWYLAPMIGLLILSCKTIPFEEYPIISFEEVVALKKLGNDYEVILIDSRNKIVSAKDRMGISLEYYQSEFRSKSSDTLFRRIIEKRPTIDERMLQVLFQNIDDVPSQELYKNSIDINCSELKPLFDSLYFRDQDTRLHPDNYSRDQRRSIDKENVEIVEEIIDKCGFEEEYSREIWLLIHHAPFIIQLKYYQDLNELYKNRIITAQEIGLLRDRMLLQSGFHQEYGSQVNEKVNYNIYDIDIVDSLRKQMGMVPLEEYYEVLWGEQRKINEQE